MNIYLVPYTAFRHVTVALPMVGTALVMWWLFLLWGTYLGPWTGMLWSVGMEGPLFLATIAGTLSATSVLTEGSLRRRGVLLRFGLPLAAAMITVVVLWLGYALLGLLLPLFVDGQDMKALVADPSFVTLRFRLPYWLLAGFATGVGPWILRRGRGFVGHLGGGVAAGALAAAVWQWAGLYQFDDLYLASALAVLVWSFVFGTLSWSVPTELYAGWVRVLSTHRYGRRIPIDALSGEPTERFVGHYPRGLDLFLGAQHGVAELHASFVVDADHHYALRGLSQAPTVSKRFLERVDVRYDPRRPAPLETSLRHEDKIVLSHGKTETVVEFLLLPKEER